MYVYVAITSVVGIRAVDSRGTVRNKSIPELIIEPRLLIIIIQIIGINAGTDICHILRSFPAPSRSAASNKDESIANSEEYKYRLANPASFHVFTNTIINGQYLGSDYHIIPSNPNCWRITLNIPEVGFKKIISNADITT